MLDIEAPVVPTSISADATRLLFQSGSRVDLDVGLLALDQEPVDQDPTMLLATEATETFPVFSPDGRFFAFNSNETGQFEVNEPEPGERTATVLSLQP